MSTWVCNYYWAILFNIGKRAFKTPKHLPMYLLFLTFTLTHVLIFSFMNHFWCLNCGLGNALYMVNQSLSYTNFDNLRLWKDVTWPSNFRHISPHLLPLVVSFLDLPHPHHYRLRIPTSAMLAWAIISWIGHTTNICNKGDNMNIYNSGNNKGISHKGNNKHTTNSEKAYKHI